MMMTTTMLGGRTATVLVVAGGFVVGYVVRDVLGRYAPVIWDSVTSLPPSLATTLRIAARALGLSTKKTKHTAPQTLVDASKEDLLSMVFHVAEDLTLRDGVVHRGVACNHCKATPIKGIRYKCANCPDFDLCADCELQEVHNPKHVFIKLNNVVPPRLNPRKPLCPQLFPGTAQPKQKILWESLKNLEAFFNLSRSTITAYFSEFQLVADSSDPPGVSPARFRELMGEYAARPNLIVDRLFFLFDRDGDGIVGFADMLGTMAVLEHGSYDEKMRLAFRGMDLDQRGHLVPDDLIAILRAFLELTVLQVTDLVSGLQSEMVQSLDDAGSKPVSALFTAPIGLPSDTPPTKGADAAMHLDQHDWTPTPTHAASSLHATPELSSKGGDAVVMFVNRIFNNRDRMDLAEFEHTARVHPLLVTWVTSLGTIF